MKLKNRTSDSRSTLHVIQKCLTDHGVQKLMFEFDNMGRTVGLSFAMELNGQTLGFKLPARIENVERIMYPKGSPTSAQRDQAYRTAWANIRDWVTAQMALIDTEMVRIEEVFLPYMVNKEGQTYFDAIREKQFLLEA